MDIIATRDDKPIIVKLDNNEQRASAHMERLLDEGHGIPEAVAKVEAAHPNLTEAFYAWLGK